MVAHAVTSLAVEKALVLGTTSQTLANSTLTLTAASTLIQAFTGSTAGQVVKLPDATTLAVGQIFWIKNLGTRRIAVQDGSGAALPAVPSGGSAIFVLVNNSSAAGVWSADVSGILQTLYCSATADFATSSTSDVLISGMSATPAEGTWDVSLSFMHTVGGLFAGTATLSIYVGGVQAAESVRSTGSTVVSEIHSQAQVTVDGSQTVEARASITSGTETVHQRSMILTRVKA